MSRIASPPSSLQRIEAIFHQVLDPPAGEREPLMRELCQGEAALLDEVALLHQAAEEEEVFCAPRSRVIQNRESASCWRQNMTGDLHFCNGR
jgi:hypothetical protein